MALSVHEIEAQVREAMRAEGIEVVDQLVADGQFRRYRIAGDKAGEKSAWAVIFADDRPRAKFGNNKFTNKWEKVWAPDGKDKLTDTQRREMAKRVAEAKRKRAREERQRRERAALKSESIWGKAKPAEAFPYLERKGVQAHGLRSHADRLLVPVRDTEGKMHSLQYITEDGTKRFEPGGAVEGHFHLLGEVGDTVAVAEGCATGASVHEATGLPVAVAFHAGNLLPVARALRTAYAKTRLVIAADNDQFTDGNPGLTKAREAAAAVKNSMVVFPEFTAEELAGKPTDFNDLAALRGPEAVRLALEAALNPPDTQASPAPRKRSTAQSDAPISTPSDKPATGKSARTWMPVPGGNLLLTEDGLKFHAAEAEGEPVLICSPLRIAAQTRNAEGGDWGRLLEWSDPDGQPHVWAMPVEMLAGDGVEVRAELLRGGLYISPGKKARDILGTYLQAWPVTARALCTDRTGWHGKAFLLPLPRQPLGGNGERVVFQTTTASGNAFRAKGELEDWQERIARPALGNNRLMLVLCAALAPPLLEPADLEGGGIHLVGPSSIGKTVALQMARSVFAAPEGLHRWRTTSNGIEATAAAHNHLPLPLDEVSQLDAKEAAEIGYALANGTEKVRATRTGAARPRRTWCLIFISSGEVTLAERAAEAGRRLNAGAEVRVLNIPARVSGHGLFHALPEDCLGNAAEFARRLTEATSDCYGTAGPAFVQWLVDHHADLPRMLRKAERAFMDNMVDRQADGQVHRAARRFALFAAAGELAVVAGVLPWPHGKATEAMEGCFRDWLTYRGGSGAAEDREALAQVRRVLEAGREARFSAWSRAEDDHAPRTQDMYGYWRNDSATGGEVHYYISSERFKSDVCGGRNAQAVARLLKIKKYLVHDPGRYTLNVRLPGRRETERVFAVRAAILEGEDGE